MPVLTKNGDAIVLGNAPGTQDFHHAGDLGDELLRGDGLPAAFDFPEYKLRLIAPGDLEEDIVKGTETHCCARPKLYCFPRLEAIRPRSGVDGMAYYVRYSAVQRGCASHVSRFGDSPGRAPETRHPAVRGCSPGVLRPGLGRHSLSEERH